MNTTVTKVVVASYPGHVVTLFPPTMWPWYEARVVDEIVKVKLKEVAD